MDQRKLFEELPFYGHRPEPDLINCPQTRDGELLKNPHWLAMRPQFSASQCGSVVGLNPYPNGSPAFRYLVMTGQAIDPFNGNDDSAFGETHEPRLRGIFRAATTIGVTEYGLFIDNVHRFQGVSPDGVTEPVRLTGVLPNGQTRFDWTAGTCMLEAKCSRRHFYEHPQAMHLCQLHLQMWVRGTNMGFLIYWNGKPPVERCRIWVVVFSEPFSIWKRLRMCLMQQHVERRVPVEDENPFFNDKHYLYNRLSPWANDPRDRRNWGTGLAYELHERYFYRELSRKYTPNSPPHLTLHQWRQELALLGMSQEQWDAIPGFAELSPTRTVFGLTFMPQKPEIYLAYEFTRDVPAEELKPSDPSYIEPVPEEDEEFFECEYMKMTQYNQFMLNKLARGEDIDAHRQKFAIQRLFITGVQIVPELARPELADQFGIFRCDADRQLYEQRLVKEEARFAAKLKEREAEAAAIAEIAASRVRLDGSQIVEQRQLSIKTSFSRGAAAATALLPIGTKRTADVSTAPMMKWSVGKKPAPLLGDEQLDPFDRPEGPLTTYYAPRSPEKGEEERPLKPQPRPRDVLADTSVPSALEQAHAKLTANWDESQDGPASPLLATQ